MDRLDGLMLLRSTTEDEEVQAELDSKIKAILEEEYSESKVQRQGGQSELVQEE